jgi:hypothetical protein
LADLELLAVREEPRAAILFLIPSPALAVVAAVAEMALTAQVGQVVQVAVAVV